MGRILKYLLLVFLSILIPSCKKVYKDSAMNLSSSEFNTIWNNYLNYNIKEYSTKESLVGYGYTEIHYYDYLCRQISYDEKVFDDLSETEQKYWLYNKYYSNIHEHAFFGINTEKLTEGIGETSSYPDSFFSRVEYYDANGHDYISFSSICEIDKQNFVYYVLFKEK